MTMQQGMNLLEEFLFLTNDKVKSLCKVLRQTGGMVGATNDPSSWLHGLQPGHHDP